MKRHASYTAAAAAAAAMMRRLVPPSLPEPRVLLPDYMYTYINMIQGDRTIKIYL